MIKFGGFVEVSFDEEIKWIILVIEYLKVNYLVVVIVVDIYKYLVM